MVQHNGGAGAGPGHLAEIPQLPVSHAALVNQAVLAQPADILHERFAQAGPGKGLRHVEHLAHALDPGHVQIPAHILLKSFLV